MESDAERDGGALRCVSVPRRETAAWMERLKARGWVAGGERVREAGERRLIPLAADAPAVLPAPFAGLPVVEVERGRGPARSYLDYLADYLPADVVTRYADAWPGPHDMLGDLVIFKLDPRVAPFGEAVGQAMLRYRPGARLALADEGVQGPLRVRALRPLAVRVDGEPRPAGALGDLDAGTRARLLSTRTRVRERELVLDVDPATTYYSPRLAGERAATVEAAGRLRALLGRPLRVVDPYAGVGPALAPLVRAPSLVERVLAADLNPDAVDLLRLNLRRHAGRARPPVRDLTVLCADARRLADDPAWRGRFDLLLVNLPHSSIEHLPDLLPLLAAGSPILVRGWAIVAHDERAAAEARLRDLLRPLLPGTESPRLTTVRTYSAFQDFTRFEAWLRR